LAAASSELVRFEKSHLEDDAASVMQCEHKWFVGSSSGCSCSFRHLMSPELGFCAPEDWYPEDDNDFAATKAFVAVVQSLVESGHQVDCVDAWYGAPTCGIQRREVDLNAVRDEHFDSLRIGSSCS